MKITERIHESLSTWNDNPVFIELAADGPALYVSARQFAEQLDDASRMLRNHGIRNGSIVIVFLNNSIDFITVFCALIEIGAKPVPVNLAYRKIELDEIITNAGPHAIVTEHDHLPIIKDYLDGKIVIERNRGKFSLYGSSRRATDREPADIEDAIASINYTYRGYGYPLGAMVPHSQYLAGAEALVQGLKPLPGENMLIVLPFSYMFPLVGCLCVPLLYGITSIISHTVNPIQTFNYISMYGINIITAVPEIYELMLNLKDESIELPSLSVFVSGGSTLSEEQCTRIQHAFNVEILHGYGLTEFTPVSRNVRSEGRTGTIGPVCGGVECRIMRYDENGTGEIAIKKSDMARSYFMRPAETAEAFENGWFMTGDTGRIEDGHLIFLGEKKRTRKVKGNMVDLEEVRRALMMYPKVQEAEAEFGNSVLSARIRIDSGKNFDQEVMGIKKFLEVNIARYKIPKVIARI